jgi:hypothetical protein
MSELNQTENTEKISLEEVKDLQDYSKAFLEMVSRYSDSTEKQNLFEFENELQHTLEKDENIRLKALEEFKRKNRMKGAPAHHKPGHLTPILSRYLNMGVIEALFVDGLAHTKSSMTRFIQQRVDEVNTLLRGIGGFTRQIKPSFANTTINYLEIEDPNKTCREIIVFSICIPDYELKFPLRGFWARRKMRDGRTVSRASWDHAVIKLSEVIAMTGLKPRYVKNDRNSLKLVMRQQIDNRLESVPDEFFEFTLQYHDKQNLKEMTKEYMQTYSKRELELKRLRDAGSTEAAEASQIELDTWNASTVDPRELNAGLTFGIRVVSLKDHGVTKDKMQIIMTQYILGVSKIAQDKNIETQMTSDILNRIGVNAANTPEAGKSGDVKKKLAIPFLKTKFKKAA